MNIGANPGAMAATQLMQANMQLVKSSAQQIQVANDKVNQVKTAVMEQTAKQASSSAQRKGNFVDVMA